MCLNILVAEGIEQACSIDADGRFQTHLIVGGLRIGVEGRLRDRHLWINQGIRLTVLKLHGQIALHRCHILPLDGNLILVDRCFEGRHRLCLRHTRHLADVGVVVGMINDQQVTVANLVGTILRLTLAVSITGVTGNT